VYGLTEQAKLQGVELERARGPWRACVRHTRRADRRSLQTIPIITNERTEVMIDTAEHAVDVAGLLNFCGVDELQPVPALVPPLHGGEAGGWLMLACESGRQIRQNRAGPARANDNCVGPFSRPLERALGLPP